MIPILHTVHLFSVTIISSRKLQDNLRQQKPEAKDWSELTFMGRKNQRIPNMFFLIGGPYSSYTLLYDHLIMPNILFVSTSQTKLMSDERNFAVLIFHGKSVIIVII